MGNLITKNESPTTDQEKLNKVTISCSFINKIFLKILNFQLFKAYEKHLQPLEKETLFNKICDPALTEADIQVLTLFV